MPEVAFHTGLSDKLGYTCRLLRKAWRQGARVVVTADAPTLGKLDSLLWTFEHEEFVPHARLRSGEQVPPGLARTPIWLADDADGARVAALQATVLVNLGPRLAAGYEQFARVIEVVGDDAEDAQQGRQRWRGYQAAGCTPKLHQLAA
ncbi:DNA polymerase III subunit chi [Aquabacterium sp.]|uniref:DNA polymerase III subunit chi n=1 Tax=Aquabacterium sp. TaxID=1872578 RepID=UPI003783A08D